MTEILYSRVNRLQDNLLGRNIQFDINMHLRSVETRLIALESKAPNSKACKELGKYINFN